MGNTRFLLPRHFSKNNTTVSNYLQTSEKTLTHGDLFMFNNSFYNKDMLFVVNNASSPVFVGPYTAGNGITIDNTIDSPTVGLISASYDFTHTTNTTVSTSTATVTFAANTRGSAMLTVSADLSLTIVCNNFSDNYIWIRNINNNEADIVISGVQHNDSTVTNVYVPSDGITVPAGGLCEIGVICNADGAFITSRNDLTL